MTGNLFDTSIVKMSTGPLGSPFQPPIVINMELDGEIVSKLKLDNGYTHRGLEKCFERQTWASAIHYCDRLDEDQIYFAEHLLCQAVELLNNIKINKSTEAVRIIISELSRISAHIRFIRTMLESISFEAPIYYLSRDREVILDLFELISGSRFSPNYFRYGGLKASATAGFIEKVLEGVKTIYSRINHYYSVFGSNEGVKARLQGIGIVSKEQIHQYGIRGIVSRASGVDQDIRRSNAYSGYSEIEIPEIPVQSDEYQCGDAYSRLITRLLEVAQSISIIREVIPLVKENEEQVTHIPYDFSSKKGEIYLEVESSRGVLGLFVFADGGIRPSRIQFCTPTQVIAPLAESVVKGCNLSDVLPILKSFDISVAELDR